MAFRFFLNLLLSLAYIAPVGCTPKKRGQEVSASQPPSEPKSVLHSTTSKFPAKLAPFTHKDFHWVRTHLDDLFKKEVFLDSKGNKFNYRIHSPDNLDPNINYPMIMYFHGIGERGTDNATQMMSSAFIPGVGSLVLPERAKYFPAYIVVGQVPPDAQWVSQVPENTENFSMPLWPSREMVSTIELVDWLMASLNIDTKRLYLTGLSMGGFAVWDLISRFPQTFAAAVPICAAGDTRKAPLLKNMSIWAFHAEDDEVVPVSGTRSVVQAIKKAGGTPKYTEYPASLKYGHFSWTPAYSTEDLWPWVFSQHLP